MGEYRHGKFTWRENYSDDTTAARAWYGDILGWGEKAEDMGPMGTYYMMTCNGKDLGGYTTLRPEMKEMGAPPHWLSYISTADVDAATARVEGNGGKILQPGMDIPDVGRIAVCMDPQGAVFALFKGADGDADANSPPPPHGDVWWTELQTSDVAGAKAFYGEVIGWKAQTQDMGPMEYTVFMVNETSPGGGCIKSPMEGVPSNWMVFFAVDDVDATVAKINEKGGKTLAPPMAMPGVGRFSAVQDPQGAAFGVITPELPSK